MQLFIRIDFREVKNWNSHAFSTLIQQKIHEFIRLYRGRIHSHFYFSIEPSKHSNNPHYTVPFVVTKLIEAVVCVFCSLFIVHLLKVGAESVNIVDVSGGAMIGGVASN